MKNLHNVSLMAGIAVVLGSSQAGANYYLGTVTNNYRESVLIASVLPAARSVDRSGLGRNGLTQVIMVPMMGEVVFDDMQTVHCPGLSWGVNIRYRDQKWGVGYEGDGIINITVNADGTVIIGGSGTPGGNGRVFPGGCPVQP